MEDALCPEISESPPLSPSDRNDRNRVMKLFIETYEDLPELWNTDCPGYANKLERQCGLAKLLEVYKQINPHATIVDVRKKINTLRSNCRRELNKIKSSKAMGNGADEVYMPTSWIFYALTFLHKSECQEELSTTIEGENNECSPAGTVSIPSSVIKQQPSKKRKAMGGISKQNKLLRLACNYMSSDSTNSADDVYLNIAKVWAAKLKSLPLMQRKLAEKSINDILFEADMGNLHRDSVRINSETHF